MPNIAILDQINSTNISELKQIYKPTPEHSGFITTLMLKIDLNSINSVDFPYIPNDTPPNVLEQIFQELETELVLSGNFKDVRLFAKKGLGPWIEKGQIRVFNKIPYYEIDLMPYFTKANTIDVADDLSLGIQLLPGSILAPNIDTVTIFGTAIEEKKNNGNEEIAARIEALELALDGKLTELPANVLLGRDTTTGIVQQIPQNRFTTLADLVEQNLTANSLITKSSLKFPAVQVASTDPATLDDYREGTWTPTLGYTTPGSSSISYSRNTGRFQKIGNKVSITFDIRVSTFSKGTASGFLVVNGLPYRTRAGGGYDNNYGRLVVANAPFSGIPFLDTGNGLSGGATYIFIFKSVTNSVNVPLEDPVSGALYFGELIYEVQ